MRFPLTKLLVGVKLTCQTPLPKLFPDRYDRRNLRNHSSRRCHRTTQRSRGEIWRDRKKNYQQIP